ncbi:MAG: hypothetical protein ABL907_16585 [Hyphomicrobium sp.]
MADDTDNLVLTHLREIRSKLAECDRRLGKLDTLETRIDNLGYMADSLGWGRPSRMYGQAATPPLDDEIHRRLEAVERRIAEIEHRADPEAGWRQATATKTS